MAVARQHYSFELCKIRRASTAPLSHIEPKSVRMRNVHRSTTTATSDIDGRAIITTATTVAASINEYENGNNNQKIN